MRTASINDDKVPKTKESDGQLLTLHVINWFHHIYSLEPKERHVRKESNGSTLGLCVVPKESHDCTLVKYLTPKESHDCSFSLT